jgi:predicted protein tyrosine phosphatase
MNPFQKRILICGFEEKMQAQPQRATHMISVSNPGAPESKPGWFEGAHLQLWFGDVASDADARQWKTSAPTEADIQGAVEFFRKAWSEQGSRILISCDYGASRSPALAYLCMADQLEAGRESEAFQWMLELQSSAVPNGMVVRLGDRFLSRQGELLRPLKEFYVRLNAELFP